MFINNIRTMFFNILIRANSRKYKLSKRTSNDIYIYIYIYIHVYYYISGIFEIVEQVIRYNLVLVSLRLINREAVYEKRKLTQTRLCITCSTISNILYNLTFTTKFNDSSILITIISCDYLNLSLADEHVGDVTIPTQVIEYYQNFLQAY
jgi:hypothetical protein